MATDSIAHQDASGAMPLGVFHDGDLLAVVPDGDAYGYYTAQLEADRRDLDRSDVEVLVLCHNHPGTAAVDCTVCVPLSDPED